MDSMGLFHAVTSYCGEIRITVTACREMLPDPAFYADCLQQSIDEYIALGDAAVSGKLAPKSNLRKKRTRKKASKARKKAARKKPAGKTGSRKAAVPRKSKGNGQGGEQPTLQ